MKKESMLGFVGASLLLGGCGVILGFEDGIERTKYYGMPAGEPLPSDEQIAGDCQKLVYDGTNGYTTTNDDSDYPDDGDACTKDSCSNGVVTHDFICCEPACANGQECVEKQCLDSCASGTKRCGIECIDLQADKSHCGACSTACSEAESCVNGQCLPVCTGTLGFPGPPLVTLEHDGGLYLGNLLMGDLNADTVGDMVAAWSAAKPNGNYDYGVDVMIGNGDGTFQSKQSYVVATFPSFTYAPVIAMGDMDGKNGKDIIVVPVYANVMNTMYKVTVLYNSGSGELNMKDSVELGEYATSMTTGDFNKDGRLDLAMVGSGNNITLMLNLAAGLTVQPPVMNPYSAQAIVAEDFNLDGNADLATANNDSQGAPIAVGTVSILLGDGKGGFATPTPIEVPTKPTLLAVGQFDDDPKPDLAVANTKTITILTNKSTLMTPMFVVSAPYTPKDGINGIATGYLSNNTLSDIVTAGNSGYDILSVMSGGQSGSFFNFPAYDASRVVLGNVDGEQKTDIVTMLQYPKAISVHLNRTSADKLEFLDPALYEGERLIGAADIDSDMDIDLLGTTSTELTKSMNDGNGAFTVPEPVALASGVTNGLVGDVDKDGSVDTVVTNTSTDNVTVLYGDGQGAFSPINDLSVPKLKGSVAMGLLRDDVQTNPKMVPDLVVTLDDGWAYLQNLGNRSFGPSIINGNGKSYAAIAIGNFDAEPGLDVAAVNTSPNELIFFSGDNKGNFAAGVASPLSFTPYQITPADLDGDHYDDLVVTSTDGIYVFYREKGWNAYSQSPTKMIYPYIPAVVGDLNGDLRPDIMFADSYAVGVILNGDVGKTPTFYPISNGSLSSLIAGRLDKGETLDIAAGAGSKLNVMLNNCLP